MDRRLAIADAAIEILATEGSRGLTHRAVDRHLGLSTGSVSYYFRDRAALVGAAADRLVELDRIDTETSSPDASGICGLVDIWLAPANRSRLIARFELFLLSSRLDAAGPLATARASMIEALATALPGWTGGDRIREAVGLIALIEGLLLDAMMGSPLDAADRRTLLEAAIQSQ